MKNTKKILQWVIVTELVFVSLFAVSFFVPLPGSLEVKIVQSGSMEPAVPVGSVVLVIPSGKYSVGDVITFGRDTRSSIPTTHRIVGIEREGGSVRYVTKGDANEEADNTYVAHSSVIGSVAVMVPRLGFVLDFARSKNGFMFMIVLPALLIMLDEIITIVSTIQSMRRRTKNTLSSGRGEVRIPRIPNNPPVRLQQYRAGIDGCRIIMRPTIYT